MIDWAEYYIDINSQSRNACCYLRDASIQETLNMPVPIAGQAHRYGSNDRQRGVSRHLWEQLPADDGRECVRQDAEAQTHDDHAANFADDLARRRTGVEVFREQGDRCLMR